MVSFLAGQPRSGRADLLAQRGTRFQLAERDRVFKVEDVAVGNGGFPETDQILR
jgi:hypothetical protein